MVVNSTENFERNYATHPALRKCRNFTATTMFSHKFRQINVLKELYYKLIWRKKFAW